MQKQPKKTLDLFEEETGKAKKEDDDVHKSTFERRQDKVKQTIDDIHDTMLASIGGEKPWQLRGEVTALARPQDSLLEEYLQFDHTTRQAPVISVATTDQLEQMIKQRVKDKAFDDVERKVKPVEMQYKYKKQVMLDQEKSKVGLGDVYEQEFLKQQQQQQEQHQVHSAATTDVANPKHDEIRKLMQSLFIKLDALSNFHYTPKAVLHFFFTRTNKLNKKSDVTRNEIYKA